MTCEIINGVGCANAYASGGQLNVIATITNAGGGEHVVSPSKTNAGGGEHVVRPSNTNAGGGKLRQNDG
ncbi:MAG: hypothetical protein JNJ99_13580 [Crocinitomicaceae bacterium]|nr:hypothetical protein [Crocinitomicaceae bacterium]